MEIKSEGFGFCIEADSGDFEAFLKKIVNTEIEQIEDISYDKGEEANIDFNDESQLKVVESDKEDKDIHIHYVPGPNLENTDAGEEICEWIEELIQNNNAELSFFALSLKLPISVEKTIRSIADMQDNVGAKALEFEKDGDTYSIYSLESEDAIVTVRLDEPEYDYNLKEIQEDTKNLLTEFIDEEVDA